MSYLGELILKGLVSARQRHARPTESGRGGGGHRDYVRWQFESSRDLFSRYPNFELAGKRVLEIGCGTGGRTAYLASLGAASVVGIDINAEEIGVAREVCPELFPEACRSVEYHVSREDDRLDIGPFDVVVLVDSMEHVVSPSGMMRLAHGYTAPGGRCYFSCIGYYHRHGSHTGLLPFVNVLFSDETILNVLRWYVSRPEYVPGRFDSDPPIERWRGIYDLRDRPGERLNKLTLGEIKKLVRHTIFRSARMTVIGLGDRRPALKPLDLLRNVPWLQEVFHSYVVVECLR